MSSALKKMQEVQMELLCEFADICEDNGLHYILFAGTLLGAIRHKGFIPWDDDIDVAMLRDDYEQFCEIMEHKQSAKLFYQTYRTDPGWFRQFSRLRMNNTSSLQRAYKGIDMHHGVFIDIFPLDNVLYPSIVEASRCLLIQTLSRFNKLRNRGVSSRANYFKQVVAKMAGASNRLISKACFDEAKTKLIMLFHRRKTIYVNHLTNGTTRKRFKRFIMLKEDVLDNRVTEFEGREFPIPRNYDLILTNMYGDYMKLPPKEMRKPHHGIIELDN